MSRARILFLAICSMLSSSLLAQQTGRFEKHIEGFEATVVAVVPKVYTPRRAWGLIVGLHGTGMDGDRMAGLFDTRSMRAAGYLTIFPSSHHRAWGTAGSGGGQAEKDKAIRYLAAVLGTFIAEYSIHPDRIHLIGYSAGSIISAYGTGKRSEWDDIKIRSISCHSGGIGNRTTASTSRKDEMAVWVLNGAEDTPHDALTRNLHAMFDDVGYDAKFTEVPGVGHIFPLVPWREIVAWWQGLDEKAPDLSQVLVTLARADQELEKKKYGKAWASFAQASEQSDGVSEALAERAARGHATITAAATELLKEAEALAAEKPTKARSLLRKIARTYKGTPLADTARERLEALK